MTQDDMYNYKPISRYYLVGNWTYNVKGKFYSKGYNHKSGYSAFIIVYDDDVNLIEENGFRCHVFDENGDGVFFEYAPQEFQAELEQEINTLVERGVIVYGETSGRVC